MAKPKPKAKPPAKAAKAKPAAAKVVAVAAKAKAAAEKVSAAAGKSPKRPTAGAAKVGAAAAGAAVKSAAASGEALVNVLRDAVRRLSIAATRPACRDDQLALVRQFLGTEKPTPPTLQLFGMPGTGKTAVVRHVLGELEARYTCVFVNGYALQRAQEVYMRLWTHLAGHRLHEDEAFLPAEQAAAALETRFRNGWRTAEARRGGGKVKECLIIVDEVDRCCDQSGKVLFRLLDWMTLPHAYCRLITIANAMHLPERLEPKTRSRLNTTNRVIFPPYTEDQMHEIIRQRLEGVELLGPRGQPKPVKVFQDLALATLCRMLANNTGDGRRLLQHAASAVHHVLCLGLQNMNLGAAATGLLEVRHVAPLLRRAVMDSFREYILTQSALLPLTAMCVITREAVNREEKGLDPAITVEFVRQRTLDVFGQAAPLVLGPDTAKLVGREVSGAAWARVLRTLVQVRFVEVQTQSEETSLRQPVVELQELDSDAVLVVLQASSVVLETLKLNSMSERVLPLCE
jgi:origin recognition complex subunit 1